MKSIFCWDITPNKNFGTVALPNATTCVDINMAADDVLSIKTILLHHVVVVVTVNA
jgi:hypothetical protein